MWAITDLDDQLSKKLNSLVKFSYFNITNFQEILPQNWRKLLLTYKENEEIVSFVYINIIIKFKFKLIYIPGGIEGKFNSKIILEFKKFIDSILDYRSLMLINFHNTEELKTMMPIKFYKVVNLHETRMIMKKNLDCLLDIKSTYTKNWRHNYNRSLKHNFTIDTNNNPNFNEIIDLYKEMEIIKKYKIFISKNYLISLFKNLRKNLIHFEARSGNKLIAFRTCLYNQNTAWDLLACSNIDSKKNYSTYLIMHEIFTKVIKEKVKIYDFSGIDIKNNIGVYNFKKGTGSYIFSKIGEYAYSKNLFLKILLIVLIFIKRIFIK